MNYVVKIFFFYENNSFKLNVVQKLDVIFLTLGQIDEKNNSRSSRGL